jgi:hypothetical protein
MEDIILGGKKTQGNIHYENVQQIMEKNINNTIDGWQFA